MLEVCSGYSPFVWVVENTLSLERGLALYW
jgi:hypothetical protein